MKILYYEVNDVAMHLFGGKYFRYATQLREAYSGHHRGPHNVTSCSDRIWEWDPSTEEVRYIKHRQTGTMTEVDLKEFTMIQLRAEEY